MSAKLPKIRTPAQVGIKLSQIPTNKGPVAATAAVSKSPRSRSTSPRSSSRERPANYSLLEEIKKQRSRMYKSILAFPFNKHRARVLSECKQLPENSKGILYWMSREQRVQGLYTIYSTNQSYTFLIYQFDVDNWSLLYAQKLALENKIPLYVCFCLVPTFLNATFRSYHFMLEGLKEVKSVRISS
jgi:deoxyribodipyrimidine photo-lyase